MAAGDSRNKVLEGQPGVLLSKKLRHGKEAPVATGAGGYFFFIISRNGVTRSIGSGNTTVVFLSAPMTVRVSR